MGLTKYLWVLVFFFITLLGVGRLTFNISEEYFLPQTYLLIFIGIVALISFMGMAKRSSLAYSMFVIIFITLIIDLIYIRIIVDKSSIIIAVSLLSAALGLLATISSVGMESHAKRAVRPMPLQDQSEKEREARVAESKAVSEATKNKTEGKPAKKKKKKKTKKAKKAQATSRAKYVASFAGQKYHVKKCGNAKKIPTKKRVYFKTKEDAEDQGYTKCRCIK